MIGKSFRGFVCRKRNIVSHSKRRLIIWTSLCSMLLCISVAKCCQIPLPLKRRAIGRSIIRRLEWRWRVVECLPWTDGYGSWPGLCVPIIKNFHFNQVLPIYRTLCPAHFVHCGIKGESKYFHLPMKAPVLL